MTVKKPTVKKTILIIEDDTIVARFFANTAQVAVNNARVNNILVEHRRTLHDAIDCLADPQYDIQAIVLDNGFPYSTLTNNQGNGTYLWDSKTDKKFKRPASTQEIPEHVKMFGGSGTALLSIIRNGKTQDPLSKAFLAANPDLSAKLEKIHKKYRTLPVAIATATIHPAKIQRFLEADNGVDEADVKRIERPDLQEEPSAQSVGIAENGSSGLHFSGVTIICDKNGRVIPPHRSLFNVKTLGEFISEAVNLGDFLAPHKSFTKEVTEQRAASREASVPTR